MQENSDENVSDSTESKNIKEFILGLTPPTPVPIDTNFTINADVVDYLTGKDVVIKRIAIDQNNRCFYNNTPLITSGTSFTIPVPYVASNAYGVDLNLFSCSVAGTYTFTISAGEFGSNDDNKNDTKTIQKNITSPASGDLTLTLTNMKAV